MRFIFRNLKVIRYTLICWSVALLWAFAANPRTATASEPARQLATIVAMGDSLTEGLGVVGEKTYPAILEKMLGERGYLCRVVNAGISGETSSGARARLEWVMTLKPDIVILETGANDGLRGLDPRMIRENIRWLVNAFLDRDIIVVLAGMRIVSNMGPEYTQAFAEIYPEIARQTGVLFIPFFLEGVGGEPHLNQADGIHPNAAGYQVIVENIFPYVVTAIQRHRARTSASKK
jgi:acyl-CoA thioesterase-1